VSTQELSLGGPNDLPPNLQPINEKTFFEWVARNVHNCYIRCRQPGVNGSVVVDGFPIFAMVLFIMSDGSGVAVGYSSDVQPADDDPLFPTTRPYKTFRFAACQHKWKVISRSHYSTTRVCTKCDYQDVVYFDG